MISQDFLVVAKLEAAERQLDQAIRLFFAREDQVSIHTLATSAYQIITDICKHKGIKREIEDSEILEEFGIKKEVIVSIREPQNFFKHADINYNKQVRLNPMLSVVFMMSCVQYLLSLRACPTAECEVFRTWFFLRLPSHRPKEIQEIFDLAKLAADPEDYEFFCEAISIRRRQLVENGASPELGSPR